MLIEQLEQRVAQLEYKIDELLKIKPSQPKYVTIKDVMTTYNVSRSWVHRLLNKKVINAINISPEGYKPNWRIDQDDLERYLYKATRQKFNEGYVSDFLGV